MELIKVRNYFFIFLLALPLIASAVNRCHSVASADIFATGLALTNLVRSLIPPFGNSMLNFFFSIVTFAISNRLTLSQNRFHDKSKTLIDSMLQWKGTL